MKMHNKNQLMGQWGNQIDPEVSAETYLNSENTTAVQWAQEHEQALEQLDRDTINLYRRHREHSDFHSMDEIRATKAVDPAKRRGTPPQCQTSSGWTICSLEDRRILQR